MRKVLVAAVVAFAALLLSTGLGAVPSGATEPGLESQFVSAVNSVRAQNGLAPLQVHPELTSVARGWADNMASAGGISHNPNLGSQVSAPWVLLGENVGTGYDVDTLMQAFVDSPTHYRNLVESRYGWIGVGVTWGTDGRMYTAHTFMQLSGERAPAPAPSVAPAAAAPAPAAAPALAPAPVAALPLGPAQPDRVAAVLAAVRSLDAGLR